MRGQEVILLNFPISHFFKSFAHSALLTEGGGGAQEPLILADVICEQPLINAVLRESTNFLKTTNSGTP